ncbi:MAG TPA: S24 family peptidase [Rhodocyclaceae bacterium]|jgi:repressor LexA|nr:S24 family peptidase [Rhodocyclaceae bacterium]
MADNDKDRDYLAHLQDYYTDSRRIPSLQRVCELMGFASKTAAKKLLLRLENAGYVERTPDDDAWIPAPRFFERMLAESAVPAGMPVAAENGAEPFMLDDYVVKKPSRTVMIPVKGDSMIDAGIHSGDIAVVERGTGASKGDFVVAIVDNEFTLKELGLERGRFVLIPHNPAYPIIRPQGELEIFGVMVGLVRRYAH